MKNGFTLIELLIVIALIVIVATIATVATSLARENARMAAARAFESRINNALGYAVAGEWVFDEGGGGTAFDSSGNGNTAVLVGTPNWKSGNDCIHGGCFEFNGSTYFNAGNSATLSVETSPYKTIAFWMKRSAAGLGQQQGMVLRNLEYSVGLTSQDALMWHYGIGGALGNSGPTKTLSDTKWHYVVLVTDWQQKRMVGYVDGQLVVNVDYSASGTAANTQQNTIIGSPVVGSKFFGVLDDVRIFSASPL